jgi:dihydropteroate synthase
METTIGGRTFAWGARAYVMGIVNMTPDSFSGDGLAGRPDEAVSRGLRMVAEGADLLDVGGESTRPGHQPVSESEELRRVLPVVEALVARAGVPVSIDTTKPGVARAALGAGASLVNDIWGLRRAPELASLAADQGAALVVMHNQAGAEYAQDLLAEIKQRLREAVARAVAAGLPRERVIVDPGLGFGKTPVHDLVVLRRLAELRELGQPVLVGPSRKSYLGRIFGLPEGERLFGTAASVAAAVLRGADVVRVHDVREIAQVVRVAEALR